MDCSEQQNLPQQIEAVRLLIEKPSLIGHALAEAQSGATNNKMSIEEAQTGRDGREILRMVLGADVLQFTEGDWKRETGHGVMLSEEQLQRENAVLEAENQLLLLENEEMMGMLAMSRAAQEKLEGQAAAAADEAARKRAGRRK